MEEFGALLSAVLSRLLWQFGHQGVTVRDVCLQEADDGTSANMRSKTALSFRSPPRKPYVALD